MEGLSVLPSIHAIQEIRFLKRLGTARGLSVFPLFFPLAEWFSGCLSMIIENFKGFQNN